MHQTLTTCDFRASLAIFEHELNIQFTGVVKAWDLDLKKGAQSMRHLTKTKNKLEPTKAVKDTLKLYMKEDIEFYQMVKEKFFDTLDRHGLRKYLIEHDHH